MSDDLEATRPARRRQEIDTVEATEVVGPRTREASLADDVPAPPGRIAHAPESSGQVYDVRARQQPVIASRVPAAPSAPQHHVDTARADADRRRRARMRAALAVIAASVVLVAAIAALLALFLVG